MKSLDARYQNWVNTIQNHLGVTSMQLQSALRSLTEAKAAFQLSTYRFTDQEIQAAEAVERSLDESAFVISQLLEEIQEMRRELDAIRQETT